MTMLNAYYFILEKEMGNPLQYPAWRIPWTKEPGRLQSKESKRVRHDSVHTHKHTYILVSIHKKERAEEQTETR